MFSMQMEIFASNYHRISDTVLYADGVLMIQLLLNFDFSFHKFADTYDLEKGSSWLMFSMQMENFASNYRQISDTVLCRWSIDTIQLLLHFNFSFHKFADTYDLEKGSGWLMFSMQMENFASNYRQISDTFLCRWSINSIHLLLHFNFSFHKFAGAYDLEKGSGWLIFSMQMENFASNYRQISDTVYADGVLIIFNCYCILISVFTNLLIPMTWRRVVAG